MPPFLIVDAFSDVAFSGNPCAVVFDSDELSPELGAPHRTSGSRQK
jgi:predicted PhzF superfamily epimerase YddE/YHI9